MRQDALTRVRPTSAASWPAGGHAVVVDELVAINGFRPPWSSPRTPKSMDAIVACPNPLCRLIDFNCHSRSAVRPHGRGSWRGHSGFLYLRHQELFTDRGSRSTRRIILDTTGAHHLHGGGEAMAADFGSRSRQTGIEARIALGCSGCFACSGALLYRRYDGSRPETVLSAVQRLPIPPLRLPADIVHDLPSSASSVSMIFWRRWRCVSTRPWRLLLTHQLFIIQVAAILVSFTYMHGENAAIPPCRLISST